MSTKERESKKDQEKKQSPSAASSEKDSSTPSSSLKKSQHKRKRPSIKDDPTTAKKLKKKLKFEEAAEDSSSDSDSTSEEVSPKSKAKRKSSKKYRKRSITPKIPLPTSEKGTLLVCGTGDMGQLGCPATEKKVPVPIPSLKDINFCDMKASNLQNALLLKNEKGETEVYTWGCNDDKAAHVLGRDGEEGIPAPVPNLKNIVEISVGQYHMTAIDQEGHLYFWGSFKADEFLGPNVHKNSKDVVAYPELHPDTIDKRVCKVASGGNSTLFLTSTTNELFEFGCTRRIERPTRGKIARSFLVPRPIAHPAKYRKVVQIACGHFHSMGLFEDAKGTSVVASWGNNRHGQLGLGHTEVREWPTIIKDLEKVVKISCGDFHNLALTEDHKVYAWGRNAYGQCGTGGSGDDVLVPLLVTFDDLGEGDFIIDIATGSNHSIAISNEGKVYSWGFGEEYQLGHGDEEDAKKPKQILSKGVTQIMKVKKAFAATSHTIFFSVPRHPSTTTTTTNTNTTTSSSTATTSSAAPPKTEN